LKKLLLNRFPLQRFAMDAGNAGIVSEPGCLTPTRFGRRE
jgi:hypothetical protein